ncbi:GNAT family N-acetyltransferase [Bacillus suaedaesalsae]|uniref:GNAT family N-acetyltransferase n=1 Tax=Bacillus suaedaesalsae TaxID=2810349 RepID=A0ABS2DLK5_9BACI|nr:GNAT family protein [Bacillus suaedaesalsae]MBM6619306.1 GNAT family N-acetyltransferase [Bacillus suaedaesalsae]
MTRKQYEAKDGSIYTIRPVHKEDAREIVRAVQSIIEAGMYIQKETVRSIKEEEAFIEDMMNKGNMYNTVIWKGKIVGIARVMKGDLSMKEHTGVFRTWIIDEAQGLGIGNAIMQSTLEWGRKAGIHKIWLTVFASNEGAHYLYKKYGFVEEGIQKGQVKINNRLDDEIFMAYFF